MNATALARLVQQHAVEVYPPRGRRFTWDSPRRGPDHYVSYRALWLKVIIRAAFDWVARLGTATTDFSDAVRPLYLREADARPQQAGILPRR